MPNFIKALAAAFTLTSCIAIAGTEPDACSPWEVVDDEWPPVLTEVAGAYDELRNVTVIGGRYADQTLWEWNGERWRRRVVSGPSYLPDRFQMIFDGSRGEIVACGGYGYDTVLWNGERLQSAALQSPPRYDHKLAYDAARAQVLLFGGFDPALRRDLWALETSWSVLDSSGPVGRFGHALAYDPVRQVTVLFGGFASTFLGDTWEWDGQSWSQISIEGPPPRFRHSMVYSAEFGGVVLYGGDNQQGGGGHLKDLWTWDGVKWRQIDQPTPPARYGHVLVNDSARSVVLVYAGQTPSAITNELWALAPGTCTRLGPNSVGPLVDCAMAFDTKRNVMVLPAIEGVEGAPTSHTWEWNGHEWSMVNSNGPPAREYAAVAFDSGRELTTLFGGDFGSSLVDDRVWEWNGHAWSSYSSTGPSPVREAHMTYDTVREEIIIVGSAPEDSFTRRRVWAWSNKQWELLDPIGVVTTHWYSIAFDPDRVRTVLWNFGETWEWDGSTWELRSTIGPPPRRAAILTYDTVRRRVVLYGGIGAGSVSTVFTDCWEWNGVQWVQRIVPDSPGPRSHMFGAFDSTRGELVLYGGELIAGYGIYADTWTLTSLPTPPGDVNGDAAVTMADLMLVLDLFNAPTNDPADLNRDGVVDFTDLNIILAHYNQSCR